MRFLYIWFVMLLLRAQAVAQTGAVPDTLGHGFGAVGLMLTTDDADSRVRFPDADRPHLQSPVVEAAVFVVPRIAIGLEFVPLGTATGSYNAQSFELHDAEDENAVLGTARWRPFHEQHVALDTVVAFGSLMQHRDTRIAPRSFPAVPAITTVEDRNSFVWAIGVDAPMSVFPHVVLSPRLRLYRLEREERDTANVVFSPSTRLGIGITAGASW